jgi:tight adherence protein B
MSRRAVIGLLAAAVVAATAGTAAAALRVKRVDLSAYPTVRVTVLTPTERTPAPRLTEDGQPVVGFSAARVVSKSVVLAVDRSRSMRGASIKAASAAARAFVKAKAPHDRIALFGFASSALELTAFQSETTDVDSGLRTLSVDSAQGTALYDTVVLGSLELQKQARPRMMILITDGRDKGSDASLDDAIAAAQRAGVTVYSIGMKGPQLTPGPLRALAKATGGTYFGVDGTAKLTHAYAGITAELRRTWILKYFTAKRPGDKLRIDVAAGREAVPTIKVKVPAGEGAVSRSTSGGLRSHWWGAALIGLLIALLMLGIVRLVLGRSRKTWLRERLAPWSGEPLEVRGRDERGRLAALAPLFASTERALSRAAVWRSLERVLERSAVPLRAVELFYAMLGFGAVVAIVAALGGASPIAILILFVLGIAGPYVALLVKATRRLRAFELQLPAALNMLAGSLKAGHSFRQALQALVEEGGPPLDAEFKRVLTEARLGRSMESALEEMGRRIGSKELDFVLRAVVIQRQVGGSLSGLLELVAETLTQRQQFRQKVKSLTASGRLSAGILCALPFFVAVMISLVSPGYLDPLFQTTTGVTVMVVGLCMMITGAFVLKRIVSFRGAR